MVTISAMPKYDTYKDTGLENPRTIPGIWETKRFRDLFSFSKGLNITKDNLEDTGIPCVNYGEIHSKYGFEIDPARDALKCVSEKYLKGNSKSLLGVGDIVFADTSEDIEGSGNFTQLIGDDVIFAGYHTVITRPTQSNNYRFLAYMLDSISYRSQIRRAVKGVKVYSITKAILKSTSVWLPELDEQIAIADFLDSKTAKLNEAIAIKKKQIALLKERKQIIIQKAVTQGLNQDAPMRDSGVEWIGQIPEHWELFANRALFTERVEQGSCALPLLSVSIHSGVSTEEISEEENVRGRAKIEDKSKYIIVKPGDVAFNMMRAWQGGIGAVHNEGMVSPAYIVARPKPRINAEYFELQYRCPEFIQQMDRYSKGITDFRKRLYWGSFKQLLTVVPPIDEQLEIIEHVRSISRKTDAGVDSLNRQIEKLKEYKTTLIDSAVTGNIKVA